MMNKEEKLKPTLYIAVIAVALGTNFGIYNSSVVNNLEPQIADYLNRTGEGQWISENTSTVWAVLVSAFTVGTAVGTVFAPFMAEFMGRKRGLILSSMFNVAGSIMCYFYLGVFELALIGRLLQGIGLGTGMPLSSAFVTEITPTKYRGKFNALIQSAFGLGDLCGMLFATYPFLGSIDQSNLCLSVTAIPASIQIIVLIFSYDTPRHLILKQRRLTMGKKALEYYQGKGASITVMNEILSENGTAKKNFDKDIGLSCFKLYSSSAKRPIMLAILLVTNLALTGITPIMTFSTMAFNSNGLPSNVELCSVTLGICNFVGGFIAMTLMERLGRKRLLTIGIFGCFLCVVAYTIFASVINYGHQTVYLGYGMVAALDFFLFFYSFASASGNTLAAEICSQKYRSFAISLANFCLTTVSTMLLYLYSPVSVYLGNSWAFLPSSCVSIILGLYLIYNVPETTGKSLSEIKQTFRKN